MPSLAVSEVTVQRRRSAKAAAFFALKNISFTTPEKGIVAVVGGNGAGKTTLLKCLVRLQKYEGNIAIDGKDLADFSTHGLSLKMSWLPSEQTMPFAFTGRKVVQLGRYPVHRGFPSQLDEASVDVALAQTDALAFADCPLPTLSSGEQRRIFIARALASAAPCLVLDEPCSHLDLKHSFKLLQELRQFALRQEKLLIITLHDIALAWSFSDFCLGLKEGGVVFYGPTQDVLTPHHTEQLLGVSAQLTEVNGKKQLVILHE